MRLRQIALVAKDLATVETQICDLFDVSICYRDPLVGKYGLTNALMPFGDTFLEVVCPNQEGTTAGRLLERRGGDGGYMVINQVDTLDGIDDRMASLGVRIVESINLEDARARHFHPRDVGAAILSLDEMTPPESWRWAGPDWRSHVNESTVGQIVGVDIQSSDTVALAERWGEVLGIAPDHSKARPEIPLCGTFIRFVPDIDGRGDGVSGIHVKVNDPARLKANAATQNLRIDGNYLTLCGTTFHLG